MKPQHVDDEHDLLTIAVAARRAGVHPETLRRWESEGLVSPTRTPGGQRRYRKIDIDNLMKINPPRSQAASA